MDGQMPLEKVDEQHKKINGVIDQLNQKLVQLFHKKEHQLIQQYKQEMIKAKQQLHALKLATNQEQLKKKMQEKKQNLQAERKRFLETSIYYSNKCKEFKQRLKKATQRSDDLKKEIVFLNNQLLKSNNKNISLRQTLKNQPLNTNKEKFEEIINKKLVNKKQQINLGEIKKEIIKKKDNNLKLKKLYEGEDVKETQFQQYFIKSVEKVKKKRQSKQSLPRIQKIADSDLNDYEKRQILEQFFSIKEVKLQIYKIIFKEAIQNDEFKQQ